MHVFLHFSASLSIWDHCLWSVPSTETTPPQHSVWQWCLWWHWPRVIAVSAASQRLWCEPRGGGGGAQRQDQRGCPSKSRCSSIHIRSIYQTLNQCWFNAGLLSTTLSQPWFNVSLPSLLLFSPFNTRHWPDVGLMLGQRLGRWPNINPTLGQRLVFARWLVKLSADRGDHFDAVRIDGL